MKIAHRAPINTAINLLQSVRYHPGLVPVLVSDRDLDLDPVPGKLVMDLKITRRKQLQKAHHIPEHRPATHSTMW